MSLTGMLVVSEDPKPPGTVIRFQFDEFRGQAKVVWRREDRQGSLLGMQFMGLQPPDRAALNRILSDSIPWN
jgi:hypothetical protein